MSTKKISLEHILIHSFTCCLRLLLCHNSHGYPRVWNNCYLIFHRRIWKIRRPLDYAKLTKPKCKILLGFSQQVLHKVSYCHRCFMCIKYVASWKFYHWLHPTFYVFPDLLWNVSDIFYIASYSLSFLKTIKNIFGFYFVIDETEVEST